jgi:hypothetical protein
LVASSLPGNLGPPSSWEVTFNLAAVQAGHAGPLEVDVVCAHQA